MADLAARLMVADPAPRPLIYGVSGDRCRLSVKVAADMGEWGTPHFCPFSSSQETGVQDPLMHDGAPSRVNCHVARPPGKIFRAELESELN